MSDKRFWYGATEHRLKAASLGMAPEIWTAIQALQQSAAAGNFKPPRGERGYWVEYHSDNPTIPWWAFKGQEFEPWPPERGSMSDEARARMPIADGGTRILAGRGANVRNPSSGGVT